MHVKALVAVLAALIIGYAAHSLTAVPARAGALPAATAVQVRALTHQLAAITTTLAAQSRALASLAAQGRQTAASVTAVHSAVSGALSINVLQTCIAVAQSAGAFDHCEG